MKTIKQLERMRDKSATGDRYAHFGAIAKLEQTKEIVKMIEEQIKDIEIAKTCKKSNINYFREQIHSLRFLLSKIKGDKNE